MKLTVKRGNGANTQMILLPGDHYTSVDVLANVANGFFPALASVRNLENKGLGTYEKLIFNIHHYIRFYSPAPCGGSGVSYFQTLAQLLRCNGRQALLVCYGFGLYANHKD
jgi:hypothetical protein